MFKLLKLFGKKYSRRALLGAFSKMIEVVFNLITPVIIGNMIDIGVKNHDISSVLKLGGLLVGLFVLSYAFILICQKMAAQVSQGLGTDIRHALFEHISNFSLIEMSSFGVSPLINRLTSDVNQFQLAVALAIRQLVRWPPLALGSMLCALAIDFHLGLIFVVCIPLVSLVFFLVIKKSIPLFKKIQSQLDYLGRLTREFLFGARVIKAFQREKYEKKRFSDAAYAHAQSARKSGELSAILSPATFLLMNFGVMAILWQGALRIEIGTLTQGQVVAFVTYMTQALQSVIYIANLVIIFTRAAASSERIVEVLETDPLIKDNNIRSISQPVLSKTSALCFSHVFFSYPKAALPTLFDIDFELLEGQTLGIIGGIGSGKTTLVQMIVRLLDPTEGSVCVFGKDVRAQPRFELRKKLAIVPQKASLLRGTIRSNLNWKDENATDSEVWSALESAAAKDFVSELPHALDSCVEAGGMNFSGGQRQRLTIARALIGDPQILILDDATSALDFATEARLKESLQRRMHGKTLICVSQRVASVMNFDVIAVLHNAKLEGFGTHSELLKSCSIYKDICNSQFAAGEVRGNV